jgi:hypothetical protein
MCVHFYVLHMVSASASKKHDAPKTRQLKEKHKQQTDKITTSNSASASADRNQVSNISNINLTEETRSLARKNVTVVVPGGKTCRGCSKTTPPFLTNINVNVDNDDEYAIPLEDFLVEYNKDLKKEFGKTTEIIFTGIEPCRKCKPIIPFFDPAPTAVRNSPSIHPIASKVYDNKKLIISILRVSEAK